MAAEMLPNTILYDEAYHLASPASPVDYQGHPFETINANTQGLVAAILCSRRTLFTSTSEVYGSALVIPQSETYWGNVNPIGPRSCYDESKRMGETICYEFAKLGKDIRTVRLFNSYGPRMRKGDGRVIRTFMDQAKESKPLTIYGDGSQTRSFCYVSDTVAGLMAAMEKGKSGEVYNIGNPKEYTVSQIAKLIGGGCPVEHKPLPQDDPPQRLPDISKAKRDLGWKPRVSIKDGLALTYQSIKEEA